MNYSNFKKFFSLLMSSAFCVGMLCACDDDDENGKKEHDWQLSIPSTIVANGDYLTTLVYGSSDYDFKVNYYWDGTLIQTTDKRTGLNFLVTNQETGDHILKIETESGNFKTAPSEFIIQVYDKEHGFWGCEFYPNNRKIRKHETLTGDIIAIPGRKTQGYEGSVIEGSTQKAEIYIDGEVFQTISQEPFKINITANDLTIGNHKLTIFSEGSPKQTYYLHGGGVGTPCMNSYNFTVTE